MYKIITGEGETFETALNDQIANGYNLDQPIEIVRKSTKNTYTAVLYKIDDIKVSEIVEKITELKDLKNENENEN